MLRAWLCAVACKEGKEDLGTEDGEGRVLEEVGRVLVRIDGLHFQRLKDESMAEERF